MGDPDKETLAARVRAHLAAGDLLMGEVTIGLYGRRRELREALAECDRQIDELNAQEKALRAAHLLEKKASMLPEDKP